MIFAEAGGVSHKVPTVSQEVAAADFSSKPVADIKLCSGRMPHGVPGRGRAVLLASSTPRGDLQRWVIEQAIAAAQAVGAAPIADLARPVVKQFAKGPAACRWRMQLLPAMVLLLRLRPPWPRRWGW